MTDAAIKTADFLVKRRTPGRISDHNGSPVLRVLMHALPFSVEVFLEQELRDDYKGLCRCRTVYRLTEDSCLNLQLRGMLKEGISPDNPPCVCNCMGELV